MMRIIPPPRILLFHVRNKRPAPQPLAPPFTQQLQPILIILLLKHGQSNDHALHTWLKPNRFGSLPDEGASAPARPARHPVSEPEADPPPIHHQSVESDSDAWPTCCQSLVPGTNHPGHVSPAPVIPVDLPAPVTTNLDPAVADHKNRPWPPCDNRELAQYKMDTKSRPSWKTIAKRVNRTVEGCQARWQWLKNTHPELLNPTHIHETGDDGD